MANPKQTLLAWPPAHGKIQIEATVALVLVIRGRCIGAALSLVDMGMLALE